MARKTISYKVFIERFLERSNEEFTYIEGYTRMSGKIKIMHNDCGTIFETTAANFINNKTGCDKCEKSSRRKTTSEFNEEIKEMTNGEYCLDSEYIKADEYIRIRHNVCSKTYKTKPQFFKNGKRCPYCSRNSVKTIDDIQVKIDKKYNFYYEVLDYYKEENRQKITVKCRKCHLEKTLDFFSFYYKTKCDKCSNCIKIKNNETKMEKDKKILKNKFIKIIKRHQKDKEKKNANDEKFNNYSRRALEKNYYNIIILEKTCNTTDKINIECKQCGTIFNTDFKHLMQGKGCPKCKASKGEKSIRSILTRNKVEFEEQVSFSDLICKKGGKLKFDFAVIDKDFNYILIEYDGKQHFEEKEQFGVKNKKEKFIATKSRDGVKNKYCKNNNIKLIRIPYWDFNNIENILIQNNII